MSQEVQSSRDVESRGFKAAWLGKNLDNENVPNLKSLKNLTKGSDFCCRCWRVPWQDRSAGGLVKGEEINRCSDCFRDWRLLQHTPATSCTTDAYCIDCGWLAHYLGLDSETLATSSPRGRSTLKETWRVQPSLQASYQLLMLLQSSVF